MIHSIGAKGLLDYLLATVIPKPGISIRVTKKRFANFFCATIPREFQNSCMRGRILFPRSMSFKHLKKRTVLVALKMPDPRHQQVLGHSDLAHLKTLVRP